MTDFAKLVGEGTVRRTAPVHEATSERQHPDYLASLADAAKAAADASAEHEAAVTQCAKAVKR